MIAFLGKLAAASALAVLMANAAPASAQVQQPDPEDFDLVQVYLCNNHNEAIRVSVASGIAPNDWEAIGWWKIEPRKCRNIRFNRWIDMERKQVQRGYFVYGRTDGILGGSIYKDWEGDDIKVCVPRKIGKPFKSYRLGHHQGTSFVRKCDPKTETMVGMTAVEHLKVYKNAAQYTFEGKSD